MKNTAKFAMSAGALLSLTFAGAANGEDQAVAATLGSTAGAVGTGVVDAGRGLVSLPGRVLDITDDGLPMITAGTQELGLSGNVNFTDDIFYNLDLSYGYFFRDCWEIGFTANAFGDDDFNLGAGIFTEYNFGTGTKWVPYVGASAKYARLDSEFFDDDSIAFGGELGVKYFLRSDMAIFAAINFEWSPDDVFGIGDEIKDNAQNINIGLRFYF